MAAGREAEAVPRTGRPGPPARPRPPRPASGVVLEADGIVAGYGDLEILNGVSVTVREGELVVVIGPNGAGKSTLLKAVVGLLGPRAGKVRLAGLEITGLEPQEVAAQGVGYVPQLANVFSSLTVRENLEIGAYLAQGGVAESIERVLAAFPALRERLGERAGRLSGGQRQMVAMGRALMLSPRLLLLDEPSAGLAPNIQDEVFALIRRVVAGGTSVLLVEQNARKALAVADWAYVLETGRNKYEGTGPELLADPNVGRLYLGG